MHFGWIHLRQELGQFPQGVLYLNSKQNPNKWCVIIGTVGPDEHE